MIKRVAEWAVEQASRTLDQEVAHHATRAIIDWYAAAVTGSRLPPAQALRAALVEGTPAHGTSSLIPDGRLVPLRTAALINATASHTAEVDDIYRDGVFHPGAPAISAAIAAAEHRRVSGSQLLSAVTVGYEISNRIAAAIQPSHYRYWHTTGTVGTIGAAASAGAALGLDVGMFMHAIGNAATMAAGLQQAFRAEAMSKPLHAGHAAEAGALSALIASVGFTGAADALDGPVGFVAAMSDGGTLDGVFDDLGGKYTIAETTFKNHTCCGHTFAAIDAVLEIAATTQFSPEDVACIEVATYGAALEVTGDRNPRTTFEAKFSTPYAVAAAIHLGSVRLAAFSRENVLDPKIRSTMGRVELILDEDLNRLFPQRRGARVTVQLHDGRHLTSLRPTRRGDPELPLTDDDISEKFMELVGEELGVREARHLLKRLWNLSAASDITASL